MTWALWATVGMLAFVGHAALWMDCFRRVAASNAPCWAVRWVERAAVLGFLTLLAWALWQLAQEERTHGLTSSVLDHPFWQYILLCTTLGGWQLLRWTYHRTCGIRPEDVFVQRSVRRLAERPADLASTVTARLCLSLPGNQAAELEINQKRLVIPGLAAELEGLVILHLSDLHMAGHWRKSFFDHVVATASAQPADVAVLTGDIVECMACLEWVTLLRSLVPRYGAYFVLGNHDKRLGNLLPLRRQLAQCGWISLGGQVRVDTWRGVRVLLAGNELPWLGQAPDEPFPAGPFGLKVALLHSPDQFAWAKRLGFQLVLAGHTHGGQIQLPWIGPLVVPCHTGIRYAAGTYVESGSVLHVSRGVSSLHLLRYNCRPELSWLTLCRSLHDS